MCGIAGYIKSIDLNADIDIKKSLEFLKSRGPDDSGIYKESNISLGHTRLSILDISDAGHQPSICSLSGSALTFNGEIYNFKKLRKYLDSKTAISWKSNSDTEVLLNLISYNLRNEINISETLKKLNGIFSFAYWDKSNKNLYIARDHFGIKPLYYFSIKGFFAFSSEIKALISIIYDNYKDLITDQRHLDYEGLGRYLTFLSSPGEATPFKFIKKLSPGVALKITNGEVSEKYIWYQSPFQKKIDNKQSSIFFIPIIKKGEKQRLIKKTYDLLDIAVKNQLVSDVPLGAFLSGGVDSSAIVALAKKYNPEINCFTINTNCEHNDGYTDDLPYAFKIAEYLNINLKVVNASAKNFVDSIFDMVYLLEEPIADPACLNVLFISRMASSYGIKVLLSGAGGDDLFSGYRRHLAFKNEIYWSWMPKNLRKLLRLASSKLPENQQLSRRIKKAFSGAHLSPEERLINYFKWTSHKNIKNLFCEKFKENIRASLINEPMMNYLENLDKDTESFNRLLALEQRFFLSDHNLLYTDKMSMASSVEVRVPFLDPNLIEHAANLPINLKQRGIQSKWILKECMRNHLPEYILNRPKTGFGAPVRGWVKNELDSWIRDLLSKENINARGIFNYKSVQTLIELNYQSKIDATYTIISLVCIELWMKIYLDNPMSLSKSSKN